MRPNKVFKVSCSKFKTTLKRMGFKVPRDFFGWRTCCTIKHKSKLYRFRFTSTGIKVDISCPLEDFDRWANSGEATIDFCDLKA